VLLAVSGFANASALLKEHNIFRKLNLGKAIRAKCATRQADGSGRIQLEIKDSQGQMMNTF
jgi:hypothetical protein